MRVSAAAASSSAHDTLDVNRLRTSWSPSRLLSPPVSFPIPGNFVKIIHEKIRNIYWRFWFFVFKFLPAASRRASILAWVSGSMRGSSPMLCPSCWAAAAAARRNRGASSDEAEDEGHRQSSAQPSTSDSSTKKDSTYRSIPIFTMTQTTKKRQSHWRKLNDRKWMMEVVILFDPLFYIWQANPWVSSYFNRHRADFGYSKSRAKMGTPDTPKIALNNGRVLRSFQTWQQVLVVLQLKWGQVTLKK